MQSSKYLELNFIEVNCQKAVNDTNFTQGVQDFVFGTSGITSWIPAYTVFRTKMKVLSGEAQDSQPFMSNNIAFAENCCQSMYNQAFVRCGGQDVSNITQFAGQAAAIKSRIIPSGAHKDSVMKSINMVNPSFLDRQNRIVRNPGTGVVVGQTQSIVAADLTRAYQVASTNVFIPNVPGLISKTALPYGSDLDAYGRNQIDVIWQPPLGIFDHKDAMPAGMWSIHLSPQNSTLYGLQGKPDNTIGAVPAVVSESKLEVIDIKMYLCTVKLAENPERSIFRFDFLEYNIQSKALGNGGANGLSNSFNFTVPATTIGLGFFIQNSNAGAPTGLIPNKISASTFKTANIPIYDPNNILPLTAVNEQNVLKSYSITYDNVTKPSTQFQSDYTNAGSIDTINKNEMALRYYTTMCENNLLTGTGGTESLDEWLQASPYIYHSWVKDARSKSTEVQIVINYGRIQDPNASLFLFSIYNKSTEVVSEGGRIESVRSLTI